MKPLYKRVRVIFNALRQSYDVQYKDWFYWKDVQSYRFDEKPTMYPTHYASKEQAEERAIKHATALLNTAVIFDERKFL